MLPQNAPTLTAFPTTLPGNCFSLCGCNLLLINHLETKRRVWSGFCFRVSFTMRSTARKGATSTEGAQEVSRVPGRPGLLDDTRSEGTRKPDTGHPFGLRGSAWPRDPRDPIEQGKKLHKVDLRGETRDRGLQGEIPSLVQRVTFSGLEASNSRKGAHRIRREQLK